MQQPQPTITSIHEVITIHLSMDLLAINRIKFQSNYNHHMHQNQVARWNQT